MQSSLHISATVQPGNKIEITDPQLMVGETVEMFLFVTPGGKTQQPSAISIIESLHGHRQFQSPEEVDQYLQEKHNSWEK
jgi:hypothetical protein